MSRPCPWCTLAVSIARIQLVSCPRSRYHTILLSASTPPPIPLAKKHCTVANDGELVLTLAKLVLFDLGRSNISRIGPCLFLCTRLWQHLIGGNRGGGQVDRSPGSPPERVYDGGGHGEMERNAGTRQTPSARQAFGPGLL